MTTNTTDISLHLGRVVVDACTRRAEELDLKMNAAVSHGILQRWVDHLPRWHPAET